MKSERRGHPANWMHSELFALPDEESANQAWWLGLDSLMQEMLALDDERSVASVCFTISLSLNDRLLKYPAEQDKVIKTIEEKLIPLWEREIDKNDDWMSIPSSVFEFSKQVGGENAKQRLALAGNLFMNALPKYSELQDMYPDESINSGIEAVMRGKRDYYHEMLNLYRFCELIKDVRDILLLCSERGWNDVGEVWKPAKTYFENLLLNIDITLTNPRLVETLYENLMLEKPDEKLTKEIDKHYIAWKFARSFFGDEAMTKDKYIM